MDIRPGISADDEALAQFCRRHGVQRLALFGSARGDDFRDDSDIDVLVELAPGRVPGLLTLTVDLPALLAVVPNPDTPEG